MPTAEEMIALLAPTGMVINLELKGPRHDEFKPLYDFELAANRTYELIVKYGIQGHSMVSSYE